MKIAIAQAYNGLHKTYKKYFSKQKVKSFLFDIDKASWLDKILKEKPTAIFWHADSKEENYQVILDRVYFIENVLKKPIFPDMNMYFSYGDKIKQNDIFKLYQIPTPRTFITFKKSEALSFIKKTKYPFVLKNPYGYGGWHVFKIDNQLQAKKYIAKIFSPKGLKTEYATMKNIFYAQEFLKVEKDLRVITVGNKTFCAYWRKNPKGWKHNINQGSDFHFENVPKKAIALCEKTSKQLSFHWMSYDLFVLPSGQIKMVELSCNFGSKGAETGGYNVRAAIVDYVIKYLSSL